MNEGEREYFDNLPAMLRASADRFGEKQAFTIAGGISYTYNETAKLAATVAARLYGAGLEKGDRIAIISENSPHWVAAYFGIMMAGGIVTPVLTDFSMREVESILTHAGVNTVFISSKQMKRFASGFPDGVRYIVTMEDLAMHDAADLDKLVAEAPSAYQQIDVSKTEQTVFKDTEGGKDDTAVIIYTSGTTGNSKGVMLTHDNLVFNAVNTGSIHQVVESDVFLSILPLAHTYECTIGMLIPLLNGATVHYTDRAPTPSYLAPLLQNIRPTTMLTVPLIIEKIYRNKVKPGLQKSPVTRAILKIRATRKLLHRAAGKKLMAFFGGRIRFFGVGGAALAPDVERFLLDAKFPYAVGYGLTETSPMLSGFGPAEAKFRSVGKPIEGIELQIHEPDPVTGEGEIIARGRNIMKGYYRNEEQTAEVFTDDGFFRTGDLGITDKNGVFYIKGRSKNMILGPNGENIYPEEIESVINEQEFVSDSLVMHMKGKLVALIHLNVEKIEEKFHHLLSSAHDKQIEIQQKAEELIEEMRVKVNQQLNKNSRLQQTIHQKEPFEKTPTQKIKRFRYKE